MPWRRSATTEASCSAMAIRPTRSSSAQSPLDPSITLAFCWSYVRCGFYDLAKAKSADCDRSACGGLPPSTRLRTAYAARRRLIDCSCTPRREQAAGQQRCGSVRNATGETAPRGPTAEVIRYAPESLGVGCRDFDDGCIELDSNSIERAMRPVCLSRKNSLFAGSDEGAENWACLASLVETCKLNNVNPQVYLMDLLTRLVNGWPQSRIDELMPWHWVTEGKPEITATPQGP